MTDRVNPSRFRRTGGSPETRRKKSLLGSYPPRTGKGQLKQEQALVGLRIHGLGCWVSGILSGVLWVCVRVVSRGSILRFS